MTSMQWIGLATGITVGFGLLYYRFSKSSEKNKEILEIDNGENDTKSKPKVSPGDDLPWSHYASLAMHNLKNQRKVKPVVTTANYIQPESTVTQQLPKTDAIIQKNNENHPIDNAQMRRLVSPKSPLIILHELYEDIVIEIQQHQTNNEMIYIATFEIGDQTYSANSTSKTKAKQNACQYYLYNMFADQMKKNKEILEMDNGDNETKSKPKVSPGDDFPWSHFASLAMYNLIDQRKVKPVVTTANYIQPESTVTQQLPKTDLIIQKNNENPIDNAQMRRLVSPKSPLMIFHELYEDIVIEIQQHQTNNNMNYIATFEIGGQTYSAYGTSKTKAKQNACRYYLYNMLADQMKKNKEILEMDNGDNETKSNPKVSPGDDFPWSHFASLAMYNLADQRKVKPVVTTANYVEDIIML